MVDSAPIDPTENVKSLVELEARHNAKIIEWHEKYQTAMRDAEIKRLDDIEKVRFHYNGIIESMRQEAIRLLAEQVKENKMDASVRFTVLESSYSASKGQLAMLAGLMVLVGIAISIFAVFYKD